MRGTASRLGALWILATLAFAAALTGAPEDRALAAAAYMALLCVLALAFVARSIASALPRDDRLLRRTRRQRPAKPPLPEQLDWLRRRLAMAQGTGRELHVYFRPLVRQIAGAALARSHGVALDAQPERARALAGDRVWDLARADRPEPDHDAPGLDGDDLRAVIDDLEALST